MTMLTESELVPIGLATAQAEATRESSAKLCGETQNFIKLVFNRQGARRQSR
ncbi:hypothetical protein SFMTTN_1381 [Sulfuriferula multivorans]|uniref:Uncharacterized protein n=1 Tax=Sulfuriferula multivorans TaxID=1559896 RepID=A0A401JD36_9PROT|nr:hypothetical protein [Sulfuriferula multivorans]GBL45571.1 hypothetical protein SFMTTN_1381 [Sulfuriferula multivorans]